MQEPRCINAGIEMHQCRILGESMQGTGDALMLQAADQFSDYFTEFRTNVELTYKKDSCIRLGYNKYK